MSLRGIARHNARAGLFATAVIALVMLTNVSIASAAGVTGYHVVQGSAANITPGHGCRLGV